MEKNLRKFRTIAIVLVVILIALIAFVGVYGKSLNALKNLIPDYTYGMELEGARQLKFVVDTTEEEKEVYVDEQGNILGEVKKGEVYKVVDVETVGNTYWYKIEYEKDKYGWIFNSSSSDYLDDVNNPEDIAAPTLKFYESIYYVNSIDEITYDHLDVEDDKPGVTITHKVYHEVNSETGKDQYWIQYTATDAVGKSVSKVQKIEFNERPSEEEVLDFAQLER